MAGFAGACLGHGEGGWVGRNGAAGAGLAVDGFEFLVDRGAAIGSCCGEIDDLGAEASPRGGSYGWCSSSVAVWAGAVGQGGREGDGGFGGGGTGAVEDCRDTCIGRVVYHGLRSNGCCEKRQRKGLG